MEVTKESLPCANFFESASNRRTLTEDSDNFVQRSTVVARGHAGRTYTETEGVTDCQQPKSHLVLVYRVKRPRAWLSMIREGEKERERTREGESVCVHVKIFKTRRDNQAKTVKKKALPRGRNRLVASRHDLARIAKREGRRSRDLLRADRWRSRGGPSNLEDRRPGRPAKPWNSHGKRFSLSKGEKKKRWARESFPRPETSPRLNDGSDEPTPARGENSKSDSLVILFSTSYHRHRLSVSFLSMPTFRSPF